ncbi:SDR family NAD(P)-dependent oxidoreductase [Bdellovibrio sp. HCB2-146]|uniref:SDR family NAD(P)-dependent oxidoreductase n=1 Tax=Bdellovibrio sp. HCB2-146 TaxID=3394362 RepID=UPI0039BC4626
MKVIFITGCSSGLGLALATHFASSTPYRLVLTARAPSLKFLQKRFQENDRLLIRELDVTDVAQIYTVVNDVCSIWGRIDVLINNAGVCFRSVIEHMDSESEEIQFRTNYAGPMDLVRAVLPLMREQGSGHIVNVSSVSGMMSMPTMASYSASKHALEGASEALWYEAKPYGIHVSLIQPGFINSASFKRVLFSKKARLSQAVQGPHCEYYLSMTPFIEKLMSWSLSSPEQIAKKVQKVIEKKNPPLRVLVTLDAFLFAWVRRVLPASLFHRIMFSLLPGSRRWGER